MSALRAGDLLCISFLDPDDRIDETMAVTFALIIKVDSVGESFGESFARVTLLHNDRIKKYGYKEYVLTDFENYKDDLVVNEIIR